MDNQQKPTLSWSQSSGSTSEKKSTTPPAVSLPKSERSMGGYISVFVGGFVVGCLVGWGTVALRPESGTAQNNATLPSSTDTGALTTDTVNGSAAVDYSSATLGGLVDSPQPAGMTVAVSHAVVTQPTWVAVYDNVNGQPGHAFGATLFFPKSMGGKESGMIELVRPTIVGKTYIVAESLDGGDHKFVGTPDKIIKDADGKPLWSTFQVK